MMTGLPKLKKLWDSYHDVFDVDIIATPATAIPARPIDSVEPWTEVNGKYQISIDAYVT